MNNNTNPSPEKTENSLIQLLENLLSVSQSLQQALMRKDTEQIWEYVSKHEELMDRFNQNPPPSEEHQSGAERNRTQQIIQKIQRNQKTNSILARSFLNVIDRTLRSLSARGREKCETYGSSGALVSEHGPILVQQKG